MRRRIVIDYASQIWSDQQAFREFDAFFVAEHQDIQERIFNISRLFSQKLNFGISQNTLVSKLLFVGALYFWVQGTKHTVICLENVPSSLAPKLRASGFEVTGTASDFWIRRFADLKNVIRCLLLLCQISFIKLIARREDYCDTRIFVDRFVLNGDFENDRFYTGLNEIAADNPFISFFLNIKTYSFQDLFRLVKAQKRYSFVFKEKYVSLKLPIQSLVSFYSEKYKEAYAKLDSFESLCRYYVFQEELAHFYYEADLNSASIAKINIADSANFLVWWEAQLPSYQLVESLSGSNFSGDLYLYVGFLPRSRDFHLIPRALLQHHKGIKPKVMVIGQTSANFFERFLDNSLICAGPAFRFFDWLYPTEKCASMDIGESMGREGHEILRIHFVSGVNQSETKHILKALIDLREQCGSIEVTVQLHPGLKIKSELSKYFRTARIVDFDRTVIIVCGGTTLATMYACSGYKVVNLVTAQGLGGSVLQSGLDSIVVIDKLSLEYLEEIHREGLVSLKHCYADHISQHFYLDQRELVFRYFDEKSSF